jgi:hypothetical protein
MKRTLRRHLQAGSFSKRCVGAQLPEFAAALMMLILVIFLPLLDLGIMPIRYFMAREVVESFAHDLSHADTFTHAFAELEHANGAHERLLRIGGIEAKSVELHLIIHSVNDPTKVLDVTKPKTIPSDWLPDSKRGPFTYTLNVVAALEISPAIKFNFDPKIPGLSGSFPAVLRVSSPWEHLARNPVTKNFYINE